jgi:hypothetical protein
MKHLYPQQSRFILITIIVLGSWSTPAWGQVDPVVIDLRNRLVEKDGEEYVEARDAALQLPEGTFNDLLFLLRLSPDYSLEQILALILEARAEHPEESARLDGDLQYMLDNPDMTGRHGGPIYRPWKSREPKELHPLIYEAIIKLDLPGAVRYDIHSMTFLPSPDNIPFILYFAKHQSPGALSWLITATEGYPEEREWLRPLAVQMYKEHREQGDVAGGGGVVGMFRGFGTPEDLEILKQLRDYEEALMPQQGFTLEDRATLHAPLRQARAEYKQRKTDLQIAEREGAPQEVIAQREQQIAEIEPVLRERERQYYAKLLWDQLEEYIQRLEAQLEPSE